MGMSGRAAGGAWRPARPLYPFLVLFASLREPRDSRRSAESSPGTRWKAFACALFAPCITLPRTTLDRPEAFLNRAGRIEKALQRAASQSLYRARGFGRPRCCASVQSCARALSALSQAGATRRALWQPAARKHQQPCRQAAAAATSRPVRRLKKAGCGATAMKMQRSWQP